MLWGKFKTETQRHLGGSVGYVSHSLFRVRSQSHGFVGSACGTAQSLLRDSGSLSALPLLILSLSQNK